MSRPRLALVVAALAAPLTACGPAAADSSPAATRPSAESPAAAPAAPDTRVSRADQARIRGRDNAPVWVLVVSDFECPFCAQWERETAPQFLREFVESGRVRVAFLNFPLSQHANALPAAEAAMCAGAQGAFWAMHDRIFATQSQWAGQPDAAARFAEQARAIGLDLPAYQQCLDDRAMVPMIQADVERAQQAGASSTPTFFIGSQQLAGAQRIEAFRTAIAEAEMGAAK